MVVNVVNVCLFLLSVSEDAIASLSRFSGVPRRFEENDVVGALKIESNAGLFNVGDENGSFVRRSILESLDVDGGLRVGKRSMERDVVDGVMVKELREDLEDLGERREDDDVVTRRNVFDNVKSLVELGVSKLFQ